MRIYFALIAVLFLGVQANAQDIRKICSDQADANALRGRERVRFEANCKAAAARQARTANAVENPVWERPNCGVGTALGACPICLILSLSLWDDGRHCF
jgi:hypothetical protein